MSRLQQYMINELFDSNVPIKFEGRHDNGVKNWYTYTFKIGDDAYQYIGLYDDEEDVLNIEFEIYGKGDPYGITNKGDALKVFAAIKKCLIDNLKRMKEKPAYIEFEADDDEPSRIKLYDRFMKTIPKVLKDYKFDKKIQGLIGKAYNFKRKGEN